MTQVSQKLLNYLRLCPKQDFTAQSVFLESGIDFGGVDLIERAFDELVSDGEVEVGSTYITGRSYHLI